MQQQVVLSIFILDFAPTSTDGTLIDCAPFYNQAKFVHHCIECVGNIITFLDIRWKFGCPFDLVGRPFIPGDTFVEE